MMRRLPPTEAVVADRRAVQVSGRASTQRSTKRVVSGRGVWSISTLRSRTFSSSQHGTGLNLGRVRHVSGPLARPRDSPPVLSTRGAVALLRASERMWQNESAPTYSTFHISRLTRHGASTPVRMAVTSRKHSLVPTRRATYTMGRASRSLGHGDIRPRYVPTLVSALAQPLTEEEKRALEPSTLSTGFGLGSGSRFRR